MFTVGVSPIYLQQTGTDTDMDTCLCFGGWDKKIESIGFNCIDCMSVIFAGVSW